MFMKGSEKVKVETLLAKKIESQSSAEAFQTQSVLARECIDWLDRKGELISEALFVVECKRLGCMFKDRPTNTITISWLNLSCRQRQWEHITFLKRKCIVKLNGNLKQKQNV